jgi:hypothetical protein
MFAILSFMDEMGVFDEIKVGRPWIKGMLAIGLGIVFYIVIGLRHLEGGRRHGDVMGAAEPARFARWDTNTSAGRNSIQDDGDKDTFCCCCNLNNGGEDEDADSDGARLLVPESGGSNSIK